jgi:tetratricopeptide (TPR) repeat protein
MSTILHAQLGPLVSPFQAPQAKSQEELDVYLRIISTSEPSKTIHEVDELASEYPKSDLLGIAFQYEMFACQQINDFDGLLAAGQKALSLQPNNVNTLLTMALAISENRSQRPDERKLLKQGEDDAQQAIQELSRTRIPRRISMEQWKGIRAELDSRAHEALGNIAMQRGNPAGAIAEFEIATRGMPRPDGRQFYRLGLAYERDGRTDSAQEAFQRAVSLGPKEVHDLALMELKKVNRQVDVRH